MGRVPFIALRPAFLYTMLVGYTGRMHPLDMRDVSEQGARPPERGGKMKQWTRRRDPSSLLRSAGPPIAPHPIAVNVSLHLFVLLLRRWRRAKSVAACQHRQHVYVEGRLPCVAILPSRSPCRREHLVSFPQVLVLFAALTAADAATAAAAAAAAVLLSYCAVYMSTCQCPLLPLLR